MHEKHLLLHFNLQIQVYIMNYCLRCMQYIQIITSQRSIFTDFLGKSFDTFVLQGNMRGFTLIAFESQIYSKITHGARICSGMPSRTESQPQCKTMSTSQLENEPCAILTHFCSNSRTKSLNPNRHVLFLWQWQFKAPKKIT